MREIKFRAWDKVAERMFDKVEYIGFRDEVVHLRSINIRNDEMLMEFNGDRWQDIIGSFIDIDFSDIELMQYTGLKDKNGVEIYEGDIVRYYSHDATFIYFDELNASFSMKYLDGSMCENKWSIEMEVIGNIYENPELLKADQ